jgi:hypothetical protein
MAADLSDTAADRTVYLVAAGLVVLGIALAVATVWWWRSTRPEHPVLGPLEVMGERRFRRSADSERRQLLSSARPPGAEPSDPVRADPEPVDLTGLAESAPAGFDDLLADDAPAAGLPAEPSAGTPQ